MKWYCMLMYRLWSDRTGFSANLIAAVLSHQRALGTDGISNSNRLFLDQIICLAVSASAMYSASMVEAATEHYVHPFQEMVQFPSRNIHLLNKYRVLGQLPQDASEKPSRTRG